MRKPDGLRELLIAWGNALAGRHEHSHLTGSPDVHILAKARSFAPGTRANFAKRVADRDGRDRRSYMAQRMTAEDEAPSRMRMVPKWAVDPVPCPSSYGGGGGSSSTDSGLPPHLLKIDQAARELSRRHPDEALCLRLQYTLLGPQEDKAARAAQARGTPMTLRQYKAHLARAREWMRGRLAGMEMAY